ncbi:hypothetical protein ASPACDRAFT_44377 [Aspergillus aculeatus ATCC 16872]|uniref:Uncharacterized protein n=1 Tax=Aspergillus aculeatus (strain ATCC 16872 / CBS 172.66 / WB 5094) TaxID=690307 RepID=A0A1L9WRC6_ASPA1|nr:uncharacterized protein ASPACDRAFT_44377 [Aspergillus aculeatus ATCC 16872]OJJ98749.1 hypothetical protein ASPACDRAFT_44377 [Aspergillus aculeatus ATCC 16872]
MARYDISALMGMRSNARIDVNRFSEVGSNLLRQHSTSVLSEQSINRSRNVSNFSRQSERTTAPPEPPLRSTSRQPSDPPCSHRVQNNSGFAQFLKEHTSPKHQRVTAGGRIVPMEAPPKMKLPTYQQQQKVGDDRKRSVVSATENQNNLEQQTLPTRDTANGTGTSKHGSQSAGVPVNCIFPPYGSFDPYLQTLGQTPNLLSAAGPSGLLPSLAMPWPTDTQQLLEPEIQAPEYHIPAAPEFPMLNYANPCIWQPTLYDVLSSPNPLPTFAPSIQPHPTISTASDFSAGSMASSGGATPLMSPFYSGYGMSCTPTAVHWYQLINGQAGMQPQQVTPAVMPTPLYQKSLDDATKEHDNLSAQLARLDRYMAMHTWDLDPQTKKLLVEQRVGLVKELDTVRIYREHLEYASAKIRMNTLGSHAGMSESAPPTGMYLAGNAAIQPASFGQAICTSSSDSTIPAFAMPSLATAFPPQLSSHETGSSTPMALMPWQGSTDYFGHLPGSVLQETNTSNKAHTQSQRLKPKRPISIKVPPANPKNDTTSDNKAQGAKANETPWTSCTKDLPLEVLQVYRQTGKIARQGDTLDVLLQDLKLAAEQSIKQTSGGYYPPSSSAANAIGDQRVTTQMSEKAGAFKSKSADFSGPDYLRQRSSRDSRKYRNRPRSHEDVEKSHFVAVEEEDARSMLSYVSTTDSWATVHEKESAGSAKRPTTPFFEIPNSVTQLALMSGSGGIGNPRTAHRRSGPALADDPLQSRQRSNVESVKHSFSPLLAPCLIKDRGLAGPKTMALAVPQNVHAHGILPHFARMEDVPRKSRAAPMTGHEVNSEWQPHQLHDHKQKDNLWYKPDRGMGT